jgi:5-methylcytosine-specific restriction endonuclease McrA
MARALVLNATYEPLSVVPSRRALVLVLAGRAEILHASEQLVRSEHLSVEMPSVVRLRSFVKVPFRRRSALSRRGVFARDGWECQYCGNKADSIDHVHPKSKGGLHSWDNVVAACRRCNTAKRDRLLAESGLRLRTKPIEPPGSAWVTVAVDRVPDAWLPYIGTNFGSNAGTPA